MVSNKNYKTTNSLMALRWLPYIVLAFTLAITLVLWQISKTHYKKEIDIQFNDDVQDAENRIKERMYNYGYTLNAILAFIKDSSDHINQKQWHDFIYILERGSFDPGVHGIGYSTMFTSDALKSTEKKLSDEHKRTISITSSMQRDLYSAVAYLEPFNAQRLTAIGFDMYSMPVLAEAMQKAMDAHKVVMTETVDFSHKNVNETGKIVLMYMPVYMSGASIDTTEQRRASIQGFIYNILNINDLIKGTLPLSSGLDLKIYDITDSKAGRLLYSSSNDTEFKDKKHFDSKLLEVGGRRWKIDFSHTDCIFSYAGNKESLWFLVFGMFFSFILFGIFFYIAKIHRTLHSTALLLDKSQRINAALSASNKAVIESKTEQELFTSVCRYAVQYGGMNMAWIGIADESTQTLEVSSFYGDGIEYLKELDISIDPDNQTSQGPTGRAFHDKEAFWCQDFQHDPITKLWHERGAKFGWMSSASIPLFKRGAVIGVLNLYLREINAFDDETKQLLLEMAINISHGLDSLESTRQRIKVEDDLLRLSQVVSQNPYPTIITDLEGVVEYSNPACLALSGYTDQELLGEKMNIFSSGMHEKEFYTELWETVKTKKTIWTGTLIDRMKNGELRDCYSTIFPLFDTEGKVVKFVSIKQDMTEINQKDKLFMIQTRQAQMGEMISMIAHQWRQPLAIINAIVGSMRVEQAFRGEENDMLSKQLKKIEEQSIHLSQTITDFKDFFRPDKDRESTSFANVLANAVNLVDHSIKSHDISLEQTVYKDPLIQTYVNEVLQVVITLIKNSIDAFEENKIKSAKISISIDQVGKYAVLAIEDNAGGITPEVLEKIFLPYFTTKKSSNGTGLGLYMSRMVIEEHCNGKIEVSSNEAKTMFKILLPVEAEA